MKTLEELQHRLMDAKERMHRLHRAESRRESLQKRLREQERVVMRLELELESEQADVEKLMRLSLTNLFHTILRSKDEQLELERQQALAAALKLQEAKQELEDLNDDLKSIGDDLLNYRNAEHEYSEWLAEKEAYLRSAPASNNLLLDMDEQIADHAVMLKELAEAVSAGKRVMASLEDASASLEKAENWGNWDMWGGGGMISTHLKHNHIDDAKQYIHNANHLLQSFQDELEDLKRSFHIQVEIDGLLKMADYWFDGLITDWVVQGRIKNAQEQVLEALDQIRTVVLKLQAEHTSTESALQGLKSKRTAWIEQSELE
ncbi:hypothetical protein [Marinicrinis lubricantis]|uniref:Uncharacterized protein n=1 Tax=Marinicrinis lubricantis TaxID=2086470 RepID=A0ABW1ILI7_9BACL